MTVDSIPLAPPRLGEPWTVDDLDRLPPDTAMKYEIIDGSLVVSPLAGAYHGGIASEICFVLNNQTPPHIRAAQETGVRVRGGTTYFEPDALVAIKDTFKKRGNDHLHPSDVLIVIEVLSKSNRAHDLVTKRHHYAVAGIPHYWIADPDEQTLTILTRNDDGHYEERAVLRPGDSWKTDEPFPLTIDPAEIF